MLLDDPAHLPLSHWGSSAEQEFLIIEQMIASYVMPPQLTADLYRALGQIPGLRVDEHAVDLAGRTGIGFIDPPDSEGASDEIILSPRTYQLMGVNTVEAHHHVVYGTAILSQARVSSPGTLS